MFIACKLMLEDVAFVSRKAQAYHSCKSIIQISHLLQIMNGSVNSMSISLLYFVINLYSFWSFTGGNAQGQ